MHTRCKERCPVDQKDHYDVFPGTTVLIPPGTKLWIYVNVDPDDPDSDVEMFEARTSDVEDGLNAVLSDMTVYGKSCAVVNKLR